MLGNEFKYIFLHATFKENHRKLDFLLLFENYSDWKDGKARYSGRLKTPLQCYLIQKGN